MILFLRSSDIGIDSRLRRYCRALRDAGLPHTALFWDRDGKAVGDDSVPSIRYCAASGYRSRRHTGLKLLGLNLFAFRQMWAMRKVLRLVHAVDLDTACAAWLLNLLTGIPFIYDIYDSYPDSRGIKGVWSKPFDWIERRIIRDAAITILADISRTVQHAPILPHRLMVIENVPDVPPPVETKSPSKDAPLLIGYLGTLEPCFRGLEDVLAVVEDNPQLELHVGGTGALLQHVLNAAARCPRITFHGPMSHEAGLAMLAQCDIVLGLYYTQVINHRFAAPNKYYEHLLLGKPMLTSQGTPPGSKVTQHDTGWAVSDDVAGIRSALQDALTNPDLLKAKGRRAAGIWRQHYAAYFETMLAGEYVRRVAALVDHQGA